jgi:transcriptional regulator with XRE-family HTH domain
MNNKRQWSNNQVTTNETIGKNLRFIRKLRKLSLVKLGAAMNITYQQIEKYEHAKNQMNAFRLWQAANILKCKLKYFFDPTYIERMTGYHTQVFHAAIAPELLDIDQLQADAARELDFIEYREQQKGIDV